MADYLLLETGDRILLESGDGTLLELQAGIATLNRASLSISGLAPALSGIVGLSVGVLNMTGRTPAVDSTYPIPVPAGSLGLTGMWPFATRRNRRASLANQAEVGLAWVEVTLRTDDE